MLFLRERNITIMKKILLTVFVCVLVVVPAFCGGAKETKTENVITDISQEEKTSSSIVKEGTPIVRVNLTKNDVVTQQDLDEAYDYYKEIYGKELTSEDVLDALIDDIIFKQGAERDGYSLNEDQKNNLFATQKKTMEEQAGQKISDEDFDKYLQNNTGMSVEDYKEYLASQYILQSYVMGVKKEQIENVEIPTEDQIKKLYEENVDQFVTPDYVKISHIFFQFGDNKTADYSKAVNVLNQIKNGSITFEKAAQSYSEDESTKGDSGLIDGWIEAENSYYSQMFGEKAVEEIFKLNPGEYSDVVEGALGYHIFKLTSKRDGKQLTLDDAVNPNVTTTLREYLMQTVYEQETSVAFQNAYLELVQDLRSQASIKYLNK